MSAKILNLFDKNKNKELKEKTKKQVSLNLKESREKIILFYDFLQRQFEATYLDEDDFAFFCEKKKILKKHGNFLFTKEDEQFIKSLIHEEVEAVVNGLLNLLAKEELKDLDYFYGCLLLNSRCINSCSQCFWGNQKGICGEKLKTIYSVFQMEGFTFTDFISSEAILSKIEDLFL